MSQQRRRSGKRKDRMNLNLPPNFMLFWVFIPRWMLMYCFAGFFFNLTLYMTKFDNIFSGCSYGLLHSFKFENIFFRWAPPTAEHVTLHGKSWMRFISPIEWFYQTPPRTLKTHFFRAFRALEESWTSLTNGSTMRGSVLKIR